MKKDKLLFIMFITCLMLFTACSSKDNHDNNSTSNLSEISDFDLEDCISWKDGYNSSMSSWQGVPIAFSYKGKAKGVTFELELSQGEFVVLKDTQGEEDRENVGKSYVAKDGTKLFAVPVDEKSMTITVVAKCDGKTISEAELYCEYDSEQNGYYAKIQNIVK